MDDALSSHARVKCLRMLSRFPAKEFTGREMAALARTSPPQAIQALGDLENLGLVRMRRAGAAMLWQLRAENVMVSAIQSLFERERTLRDDVVQTIGSELPKVGVSRALLYGSVARKEEQAGSDIDLYIEVANEKAKETLRPALDRLGTTVFQRYGVPLSILIYSHAEVRRPRNPRLLRDIESEGIVVRGT